MASDTGEHVTRVNQLLRRQGPVLDAWLRFRCEEEPDLDFNKLKRSCGGYIEWCSLLAAAAAANLKKRRWSTTRRGLIEERAAGLLKDAETNPVQGPQRVPTLLSRSFVLHDTIRRLSNPQARFVDGDLEKGCRSA